MEKPVLTQALLERLKAGKVIEAVLGAAVIPQPQPNVQYNTGAIAAAVPLHA